MSLDHSQLLPSLPSLGTLIAGAAKLFYDTIHRLIEALVLPNAEDTPIRLEKRLVVSPVSSHIAV